MSIESPPDGLFTHQRPEEVDVNDIDDELRETFEIIKEIDGLHTVLMCQGHPESEELFAWSTGIEIRLVYHTNLIVHMMDFKHRLMMDVPDWIEDLDTDDIMFHFITGTYRQETEWKLVEVGVDDWIGLNIKYDYETVGQRRCYISFMEKMLKEVFW